MQPNSTANCADSLDRTWKTIEKNERRWSPKAWDHDKKSTIRQC